VSRTIVSGRSVAKAKVKASPPNNFALGTSEQIHSRKTPELVFGLVGPVGAGVSQTSKSISSLIQKGYGYEVTVVKVSDIIKENKDLASFSEDVPGGGDARIQALQEIGSSLRQEFGSEFLAAKCAEFIGVKRAKDGYADEGLDDPTHRRHVTIIDSLKNEAEVELFRAIYGPAFWLIGIFASEDIRTKRLRALGVDPTAIQKIIELDSHEGPEHGQDVRDTFLMSDYFFNNNSNLIDDLDVSIERFLGIVFANSILTPTEAESGMAAAKQAGASSSCLSRQVGAVIKNTEGSTIGTGWNEVPAFGGGVYPKPDKDFRCFKYGNNGCRNDQHKINLLDEIITLAEKNGVAANKKEAFKAEVKKTRLSSLIEFSRSVHAEMAAIIDVARNGLGTLNGSTLYVTTFPCHNCARHIIFAGVRKVIYIEPYSKSLALELHDDALTDMTKQSDVRDNVTVQLEPFEGVGPSRFYSVFVRTDDIKVKETGKERIVDPMIILPAEAANLDAFSTLEKRVIETLMKLESGGETDGKV